MQQELKELQPELIETSKETEQLIKIIADETLEVEDKKRVNFTTPNYVGYLLTDRHCKLRYTDHICFSISNTSDVFLSMLVSERTECMLFNSGGAS